MYEHIKKKLEEVKEQEAVARGKLEALESQLSRAGYATVDEAKQALEEMRARHKELESIIGEAWDEYSSN